MTRKQCDNCKHYAEYPHPGSTWCYATFNRMRTKPKNKCDYWEPKVPT